MVSAVSIHGNSRSVPALGDAHTPLPIKSLCKEIRLTKGTQLQLKCYDKHEINTAPIESHKVLLLRF